MAIIATRIDGRLIHGQVANLWTTKLNISRIMVIDDAVAQNDIEKQGLKLAFPPGEKLSILPIDKAANNIKTAVRVVVHKKDGTIQNNTKNNDKSE